MSARSINVPRGEAERNIEVEGKQNSLSPEGPVIKCFVLPLDSKIEKNCEKMNCLTHTKAFLAVRAAVKPSYTTETTR